MFSVLQIWLYRFPIILAALCINAGYCCAHHRAEVQTRCEKILKAFPGVFTHVVFHDDPGESLGSIQESQNTLHIVTRDYALDVPITVPGNAINVGIVGVATDGKYPTLSLTGTMFSTGVNEFIRVSGTRLLYIDGFELDVGGSFANIYGYLNHFIHARSDRVTLKNLKLYKAGENDRAIYVEHSKKLEVSYLEIWRDGYREPPLVETIKRDTESLNSPDIDSDTNQLDDAEITLIALGFYISLYISPAILISLLFYLPDRDVRHYHLARHRG